LFGLATGAIAEGPSAGEAAAGAGPAKARPCGDHDFARGLGGGLSRVILAGAGIALRRRPDGRGAFGVR